MFYTKEETIPVLNPVIEIRLRCLEQAVKVKSQSELRINSDGVLRLAKEFEDWIVRAENKE